MQLLPAVNKESWIVVLTTLALVLYGVLQERVMTKGWGPQQELFPYSSFLVLSNRLLTVLVLITHSAFAGHSFVPVAPLRSYCLVSASNMVSTLCQYEALKYVSFVAQTLAKTAKALPVVLWGTLFGGKRYSARQYLHAILITGGCSIFVLGGDITSGSAMKDASWRSYTAGTLLLLTYLAADGWTSTQQEVLYKTHATPIREQLLYTTAFSTIYSLAGSVASGQLLPALSFLQRHPDAALAVLSLSLASTVIQVCISTVLQRHGALMFALMMTSRQCVSVLLSTVLFGHDLSISQWLGVAVAFSALYHQKTTSSSTSSKDSSSKQGTRSRAAVLSTTHRQPHARDSDPSHQPLLDSSVAQASTVANAVSHSTIAFRGSQGGFSTHSILPANTDSLTAAAVAAAASSTSHGYMASFEAAAVAAGILGPGATAGAAATAAGAGGAVAAGGVSSSSPAVLAAPWRLGSMQRGRDPYLVAVPEVQSVPVCGVVGGLGGSQIIHRQPSHGQALHQQQHHHQQQQQHSAGMPLNFPASMKPPLPVPNVGSPAALSSSSTGRTHSSSTCQLMELVAGGSPSKKPPLDLRTLWSRGTGRVMVDPTTAVALEHRDK